MRWGLGLFSILVLTISIVGLAHAGLTTQIQACAGSTSCTNFVNANASNEWAIDAGQTISLQGSATGGSAGCYEASAPYEQYSSCPPSSGSYYEGDYFFTYSFGSPLVETPQCTGGEYNYNAYWGSYAENTHQNNPIDSPFPTFYIQDDGNTGISFSGSTTPTSCSSDAADITTGTGPIPLQIQTFNAGDTSEAEAIANYNLTINPALTAPTVSISNSVIITGSSGTLKFTVSNWTGGTPGYAISIAGTDPQGTDSCSSLYGTSGSPVAQSSNTPVTLTFPYTSAETATPSTYYYCASVSDNSLSPETVLSSPVELQVVSPINSVIITDSPFGGTVDAGEGVPILASWSGGIQPYTAYLYSGTSSSCSSDTTLAGTNTGITSSSTLFNANIPTSGSSVYYCVKVTDTVPDSNSTTTPIHFSINPQMSAPSLYAVSNTVIYSGQYTSIGISWTGGTPDYTVSIYSGSSSSSCASDNTWVETFSPQSGTVISSALYPHSIGTTYYCATLTDSAYESITTTTSTPLGITVVNPVSSQVITTQASPETLSVDSGQSIDLDAAWDNGIGPFTVTFYSSSSSSCSSSSTQIHQTTTSSTASSASYSLSAPSEATPTTIYYCATISDVDTNTYTTGVAKVMVYPDPTVSVLPSGSLTYDKGQTSSPLTANVAYLGPNIAAVTWYSGSSPTCSSDNTKVGTGTSLSPSTSSTGTTYYCAVVNDSAVSSYESYSSTVEVTVNSDPAISLWTGSGGLDLGQVIDTSTYFQNSTSGGTAPLSNYKYTISPSTYTLNGNVLALKAVGTYSITENVVDSLGYVATSAPVNVVVYADPAFKVTPESSVLDSGQSEQFTLSVSSGGQGPFEWSLDYASNGTMLSSGIISSYAQNGMATFNAPVVTTPTVFTLNGVITDVGSGSGGTPSNPYVTSDYTYNYSVNVTVDPAPTATLTPSSTSVITGTSVTLTGTIAGGAGPFNESIVAVSSNSVVYIADNQISGNTITYTITPSTTGTYSFILVANDTGTNTPYPFNSVVASFTASAPIISSTGGGVPLPTTTIIPLTTTIVPLAPANTTNSTQTNTNVPPTNNTQPTTTMVVTTTVAPQNTTGKSGSTGGSTGGQLGSLGVYLAGGLIALILVLLALYFLTRKGKRKGGK